MKLPDVDPIFDYDLPAKVVRDWWTDLLGVDYIGKSLKFLRHLERATKERFSFKLSG